MAIESFTREIDGTTYEIKQFPAKLALKVLDRVRGALATAFASAETLDVNALSSAASGGRLSMTGLVAVGKALGAIKLADLEYIIEEAARVTFVLGDNGQSMQLTKILDLHFAGKLASEMKWLAVVLEVNFSDFLGVILTRLRESAPAKPPAATQSTAS